jgi:hypothetical protein
MPAIGPGLPDGHTRATSTDPATGGQPSTTSRITAAEPLSMLLARRGANQPVPSRPLSVYADAAKENQ